MKVYMAVTADKYELPVAVADSPAEMARMCGMTTGSVLYAITRKHKIRKLKAVILRLEIEDD